MNIHTPVGDVTVNRDTGYPTYRLEVQFKDADDDSWYSSTPILGALVDDHIGGRNDITQRVIQEAVDSWFEQNDNNIEQIRAINVKEHTDIRRTPKDEQPDLN